MNKKSEIMAIAYYIFVKNKIKNTKKKFLDTL